MKHHRILGALLAAALGIVSNCRAALLPGLGEVAGTLAAPKGAVVPVYLYNEQKHVGYAVFAVDGVASVFGVNDFVTVTRRSGADWEPIISAVQSAAATLL